MFSAERGLAMQWNRASKGRLATELVLVASTLVMCGCRGQSDDIIESSTRPAPFFLAPADESAAFELAFCTDGSRDDFYDDAVFFQVEVVATVLASDATLVESTLAPADDAEPIIKSEMVLDRGRLELSADFPPAIDVVDQLCSEWGAFSVVRNGDSVIRVEWEIRVSVAAENDISLETYVR